VIWALVLGTVLSVGALAFVLYPIFFGVKRQAIFVAPARLNEGDSAVMALREIEFDRATGKLSETDYAELKTRYTREAISAMRRQVASPPGAPSDDEVEAAVRAYRAEHPVCDVHGPRPEADAVFCSDCGRYLRDRCADCGAPVVERDALYCVTCGIRLAA
jgi:hypothetical protein